MSQESPESVNLIEQEARERRELREKSRRDWLGHEVYADVLVIRESDDPLTDHWVAVHRPASLGWIRRSEIPALLASGFPSLHAMIMQEGLCCHAHGEPCPSDSDDTRKNCCLSDAAYDYRLMVLDENGYSLGEASPDRQWVMSGDGNVDNGILP